MPFYWIKSGIKFHVKQFDGMSDWEKLRHIQKLYAEFPFELRRYLREPIADIWDWHDYWIPWMLEYIEESLIDGKLIEMAKKVESKKISKSRKK